MATKLRSVRIPDDLDQWLVKQAKKRGGYTAALSHVLRLGKRAQETGRARK